MICSLPHNWVDSLNDRAFHRLKWMSSVLSIVITLMFIIVLEAERLNLC
jgi:hypothetical protein